MRGQNQYIYDCMGRVTFLDEGLVEVKLLVFFVVIILEECTSFLHQLRFVNLRVGLH